MAASFLVFLIYSIAFQIKTIITKGMRNTKNSARIIHIIDATASSKEIRGFANPPVVPVEMALVATVPS